MHGNSELKCFAHSRGFYTRAYAAPKSRIEQDYIYCGVDDIGRELLEVDDDRVGGQWHSQLLAYPAHSRHSKNRVFQIIVANCFDLLSEPDRCFSRPDAVRVEAEAVTVECGSNRLVTSQLVLRSENTAFQFMRCKTV